MRSATSFLTGVVECAETVDDSGPIFGGAILVELALAFDAEDGEFEADDGFELGVDEVERGVGDLPGLREGGFVLVGEAGDDRRGGARDLRRR